MISAFTPAANGALLTGTLLSIYLDACYQWPYLNPYVPGPGMSSINFTLASTTTLNPNSESINFGVGGVLKKNTLGENCLLDPNGDFSTTVGGSATFPSAIYGFMISQDSLGQIPIFAASFDTPVPLVTSGQVVRYATSLPLALNVGGSGNINP